MADESNPTIAVRKLEYGSGRVVYSWSGALLRRSEEGLVVLAIFPAFPRETVVDGVPFCAGDIFTEYYYPDRWYNVFHIADPSGQHKGWYCNVAQPAIVDDLGIAFVDMALDLFVHPNGRYTVLDEDEFAVAVAALYSPEDVELARSALDDLIRVTQEGRLPAPSTTSV